MKTPKSFKQYVQLGLGGFFVCVIVFYGLFEAHRLLAGPQITVTAPLPGSATSSVTMVITGTARNISFLTVNDTPAYTDESGQFSITLAPPRGYTVVTIAASDRFGRSVRQFVPITLTDYCPA